MKRIVRIATKTLLLSSMTFAGCHTETRRPLELVVLDPGHFHASLLQKNTLGDLSDTVRVYAPEGDAVEQYLSAVESYNQRAENPTSWLEQVYIGNDYLDRMLTDAKGDVVIVAGNNRKKTDYILSAVRNGYNVLSDKPLAISGSDFDRLRQAYEEARRNGILVYDMMTERYDAVNIIVRELLHCSELFGTLQTGTADKPSVTMESIHHFFKNVSGVPLVRPAWYYDVEQQGEGIADVTSHLIDLLFWQCFPDEPIRYASDIEVLGASHWPTPVSEDQFRSSTGEKMFPPYLKKYVKDGMLEVMCNGTILFRVKEAYVGMKVVWNWESATGNDTFSARMSGSRAALEIVQDASTDFVKQLFVRRNPDSDEATFDASLRNAVAALQQSYPGLAFEKVASDRYRIDIPSSLRPGHEIHFGLLAKRFLQGVRTGDIPDWERENTLSKYYITTTAVELAKRQ